MDGRYFDRKAAYHEAAHAMIALYNGFPLSVVTLDGMGGGTTSLAWWHQFVMRFSGMRDIVPYMEYLMAGHAGEMLVRLEGDNYHGSSADEGRAEHLRMLHSMSMGEFGVMRYRVSGWVSDRRELVRMIAESLLGSSKLSGRQVRGIMNDFHQKHPQLSVLTRN